MIRVGKHASRAHCSRVRINPVVQEIDAALVRKAGLVRQLHLGRNFLIARANSCAFPAEADVFQDCTLIGVSVAIKRIERDESGEQACTRTRDTAADQISFRHQRAADSPVNGRANLGKFEIELGQIGRGLG